MISLPYPLGCLKFIIKERKIIIEVETVYHIELKPLSHTALGA
jgi:hypothetical protein